MEVEQVEPGTLAAAVAAETRQKLQEQAARIEQLTNEVGRLEKELATERNRSEALRDRYRRRALSDFDYLGSASNMDWSMKLDNYLQQVSITLGHCWLRP